MFKAIKILILLGIVVCAGIGLYVYSQSSRTGSDGAGAELRSQEKKPKGVRVEEKYGFTSEGVEP